MGVKLIGLLDSGAQVSILGMGGEELLKKLKLKKFPTKMKLLAAGGENLAVQGYVHLPVTFNGETKLVTTIIAPTLKRRLLLGINFWHLFGIEPTIKDGVNTIEEVAVEPEDEISLSPEQRKQLEEVKKEFKGFVDGQFLETTPLISHKIEFTPDHAEADPVRLNPYPWSPEVQKHVNEELDKWIRSGVVEKSTSDWALLIVPVLKSTEDEDGGKQIKLRMCFDARKLNYRTRRDAYPLPHQDRILGRLVTVLVDN